MKFKKFSFLVKNSSFNLYIISTCTWTCTVHEQNMNMYCTVHVHEHEENLFFFFWTISLEKLFKKLSPVPVMMLVKFDHHEWMDIFYFYVDHFLLFFYSFLRLTMYINLLVKSFFLTGSLEKTILLVKSFFFNWLVRENDFISKIVFF